MAATSQPISIAHNQRSGAPSSSSHHPHAHSPSASHLHAHHPALLASPHHNQGSLLAQHAHLANPRWAGTSPRSAESSTSWAIHPGPLFVSAGSLGSTSGSFGAASASGSAGSFGASMRARMYPGCSPAAMLLNPLEPDFKFRGLAGSIESDHGSLINAHMSEREIEQCRNFTCCGLPLNDLHALVEHFEAHHVFVVDPLNPHSQPSFPSHASASQATHGSGLLPNLNGIPARSTDSSLAGALGPSSSPAPSASSSITNPNVHPAPPHHSAFDPDDMELDMEMEMEMDLEPEHGGPAASPGPSNSASSPAPSSSNSVSSSHSNTGSGSGSGGSTRSSPVGGGAGPLPLTQPQRFAHAMGVNGMTNGTRSSLSSPPDTPLLTTPVSPFAFPWAAQAHDGLTTPMPGSALSASSSAMQNPSQQGQSQAQNQNQNQNQVAALTGPPAFDSVHLPPKHGGMFAHPYAGASSARRHPAHPLSPLSSSSSVSSTSGTTSPSSASASAFGYLPGSMNGFGNAGGIGSTGAGPQTHGLHHTQSLYALRLARHVAAEREREEAQLVARALNGYAGYEDYSRGFPGTGDVATGDGVGIAGAGGVGNSGMGVGIGGGMERMNVGPTESAIHPGLLFGNANGNANGGMNGTTNGRVKLESSASARTTPAQSRSGSPSSSALACTSGPSSSSCSTVASASASTSTSTSTSTTAPARKPAPTASTTLSRPSSSLLLSKPFKCPTPGCTKSYKQANGLKYHVTHGQCSFTPPPELSSISELGLSIGLNLKIGPMGIEGLEGMSERDRREAEREAERRLRPFCCQVKPCQRRYKNMNGLRYHYQHSGEHGAIGLRMLASGRHDATRSQSVEEEEDVREGEGEGEKTEGERGQTSSAPSTPGPRAGASSQPQNANQSQSPFTTQVFAFQQQQAQQQQQQQQQLHQRSLSGSSASQPLSPLSKKFPSAAQNATQFGGHQMGQGPPHAVNGNGVSGVGQLGPQGPQGQGQYAFAVAVQSQPASAYASPWGSRAGSPTGVGLVGLVGMNGAQAQWGSQGMGQGQGQDAMMSS